LRVCLSRLILVPRQWRPCYFLKMRNRRPPTLLLILIRGAMPSYLGIPKALFGSRIALVGGYVIDGSRAGRRHSASARRTSRYPRLVGPRPSTCFARHGMLRWRVETL
jgi:hypothetical protein